ncbi:L,D-transpeptidase family protein [Cumulibacter manganitolerans]|uniref:L,D-transpeptidase family protein n=1 Tax=Cumulibacter manganitolerans TaxID=1884992 RepID=UPI001E481656|nr:L,D-transpeptidase family protein [Cumulibacter manganitolerans]
MFTKAAASIGTGESVKVSITVQTPNPGVPFGDVTLVVDGAGYATATLNTAGNMAFTVKGLADGDHSYYAKFAGNPSFLANQSKAKSLHVLSAAEIAAAKKQKEEQAAAAAANPCPATAEACVDLTSNTTWLQKDGVVTAGPFKQIAGRNGHRTPPGTYTVQWKDIDHLSKEFDNAPMPYSIFFNGEGMAFHVGSLSTPSHGCVHLSESAAKTYWDALQPGDVVYIYGSPQY